MCSKQNKEIIVIITDNHVIITALVKVKQKVNCTLSVLHYEVNPDQLKQHNAHALIVVSETG